SHRSVSAGPGRSGRRPPPSSCGRPTRSSAREPPASPPLLSLAAVSEPLGLKTFPYVLPGTPGSQSRMPVGSPAQLYIGLIGTKRAPGLAPPPPFSSTRVPVGHDRFTTTIGGP